MHLTLAALQDGQPNLSLYGHKMIGVWIGETMGQLTTIQTTGPSRKILNKSAGQFQIMIISMPLKSRVGYSKKGPEIVLVKNSLTEIKVMPASTIRQFDVRGACEGYD
jgi:hypothetical protein